MLNKILIPAALIATVIIAGTFAFMPVEKASTVHGTLATSSSQTTTDNNVDNELDALDRAIHFSMNMSRSAYNGATTIIPGESGKAITGYYILTANPNNSTQKGLTNPTATTFECGLVDNAGNDLSATNATKGVPANGTLTVVAGRSIAIQYTFSDSNVGGICAGTIFIDKNAGETVPES